ncbi:hypothetical protein Tco_0213585 [Tanacetum coccineum]
MKDQLYLSDASLHRLSPGSLLALFRMRIRRTLRRNLLTILSTDETIMIMSHLMMTTMMMMLRKERWTGGGRTPSSSRPPPCTYWMHYRDVATLPSSSPPPENVESLKDNIRDESEEIERVIAERVANAIEAIAIYETKTNMARKSISQTEQQECKVAENANNKRKWEGNHNGQCTVKFGNCKKVDHMTQDCRNPAAARNQQFSPFMSVEVRDSRVQCPI